jgi:DUF1365 family protein
VRSALAFGTVRHRRFAPVRNDFAYRVALLYIDLSETRALFRWPGLLGLDRPGVYAFRRKDYLGDPSRPLEDCVRDEVQKSLGFRPAGPVRMLTQISALGFCFNPVTFYYCFGADGETPEAVVAHITNTPWNQRHAYALAWPKGKKAGLFRFKKDFHVSPFMPMDQEYRWLFTAPARGAAVHMENFPAGKSGRVFDATLAVTFAPWTAVNLFRALVLSPFMTLKSVALIHWQAFLLWLKRAPFHPHPMHKAEGGRP